MAEVQRVALITGSATGVGRACAIRFAQLGFAVIVNYSKSEEEAIETAQLCEQYGVPVQVIAANIGDDNQVRGMIGHVVEAFGGLDVLVNNAGTTRFIAHTELDAITGYNTYREVGLPIGPIANPGRSSIAAVLDPQPTKALYFVADGTGGHVFAETLGEHNANVAKWFAIRRQRGEM